MEKKSGDGFEEEPMIAYLLLPWSGKRQMSIWEKQEFL